MQFSSADEKHMNRALQLAKLGGVDVAPNPMVGAVIVLDNKIIGEGYHECYGESHAEVNAVNSVKDHSLLQSSTIYVTLEPCAHHGKTPPCADLIIKSQFKRVVIACEDSFSEVAGKGIQRIKDAGIDIEVGILENEARNLNKRFFTFHEKNRPYVILKWAQTQDGLIDRLPEERERGVNWITLPSTKLYVHKWRSEEQAIMVGWKTVANDDPQLNVRKLDGASPHRFIIDPHCNTPLGRKIINDGSPTTIIVKENTFAELPQGVELATIDDFSTENILSVIKKKGFLSVFIEGGAYTLNSFISSNLWDEARVIEGKKKFSQGILAPKLNHSAFKTKRLNGDDILTYYFNK
ncbi:MAG: bifunctional diaminohydroxyphosphoribosylaminopyrimidine deaminase/5-amino-6-(5-phosphoribosylamino)uracil reductase RibD [Brumimicrobium sp.]